LKDKLLRFGTMAFLNCSAGTEGKPMLAIAVTLALFGFAFLALVGMVRTEGQKMLAAFEGHSWASQQPSSARAVTLRFSPHYPVSRPRRASPELRVAA
jgi:hypothetical protein